MKRKIWIKTNNKRDKFTLDTKKVDGYVLFAFKDNYDKKGSLGYQTETHALNNEMLSRLLCSLCEELKRKNGTVDIYREVF